MSLSLSVLTFISIKRLSQSTGSIAAMVINPRGGSADFFDTNFTTLPIPALVLGGYSVLQIKIFIKILCSIGKLGEDKALATVDRFGV